MLSGSLVLAVVIPVSQPERAPGFHQVADVLSLAVGLVAIGGASQLLRLTPGQVSAGRFSHAVLCSALPIISWTLYLSSVWPGVMSNDSLDQWNQMQTWDFNDWHPVFHTLTNWLITRLWLSPSAIALFQILTLGLVVGWALASLERLAVNRWILWTTSVSFAVSPGIGVLFNTLWKDIPYSTAILLMSVMLLNLVSRVEPPSWRFFGRLGIVAAAIALYRHNGWPVAFATLIIAGVLLRGYRLRFAFSLTLCAIVYLSVRGPLYTFLQVSGPTQPGLLWPVMQVIGAHTVAGTPISRGDRELLERILPVGNAWPYTCTIADPIAFNSKLNVTLASEQLMALVQMATRLSLSNPAVLVTHIQCNGLFIGRVTQPQAPFDFYETLSVDVFSDPAVAFTQSVSRPGPGVVMVPIQPLLPSIAPAYYAIIRRSVSPDWSWLFWRPAFFSFLGIAGMIMLCRKQRDWRYAIVLLPVALNGGILMMMTVGQGFRLVFSHYLVGLWLTTLISLAVTTPSESVVSGYRP